MIRATFSIENYPYELALVEAHIAAGDKCPDIYRKSGLSQKVVDLALECIDRFPTKRDSRAVFFHLLNLDLGLPKGD